MNRLNISKRKPGRKPLPEVEKKVHLPVFIEKKIIADWGGVEACREAVVSFLQNSEKIKNKKNDG